jgi:ACDE family multidrug resistance protein
MNSFAIKSKPKSANSIYRDRNFHIIISVTLVAIMAGTIVTPTLPALAKVFNVSPQEVGMAMTAFLIPVAIGTPIFGVLADRIGRKQILVPSLCLFAVAGGFSAFASDFHSFLGWRFLQGIGAASLESLELTMIGDLYTGKILTAAMAFNASIIGISSTIFPIAGGTLGGISWRYPYLLSLLAFPIAFLVLMVLKLPKSQKDANKFNLNNYLAITWKSIRNRSVIGLMFALAALFAIQFGAFLTYIPILAGGFLGASGATIGIILASMSLSLAFVASQLGLFARKFKEITLIKISFVICALGLSIVPFIDNVWLLFIPSILIGAAAGLAFPSTQSLLAGLAAQDSRAGFMAVNATVQATGQALGPLMTNIAFAFWGIKGVFYSSAVFALASLVLFNSLMIQKRKTKQFQTATFNSFKPDVAERSTPYFDSVSPTTLQKPVANLVHSQSDRVFELPEDFSVIRIGKLSNSDIPAIDLSHLPNAEGISRHHAEIRFDGEQYYIKDLGSSHGTYIYKYPMLPGVWYKLKSGLPIAFGKRGLVSFMFEIN